MKKIIFILLLLTNISLAQEMDPTTFIKNIINESKPALIKENKIYLEKTMSKYIDFNEIALWVAGKNIWKDATQEQKKKFIKELKHLLLKTYSKTIYHYVDSDVEFITNKTSKINNEYENRIQISSIMKKNNKNITITYRLIKNKDSWLVFDVIIEGISILKSLKTQYSEIIRKNGIDIAIKKFIEANSL